MERYLDPRNDVAFKKVFATEDHKSILIHFLNAVMNFSGEQTIVSVELMSPAHIPFIHDQKQSICDVKCRDQTGNIFIIEMQNLKFPEFGKRIEYYASFTYATQLKEGERYSDLKPIYVVAIINYNLFPGKKEYIHRHEIRDVKTNEHDLKDISYAFVDLYKFDKAKEECLNPVDQWIYFLKHAAKESEPSFEDTFIHKAYETLERYKWNVEEYDAYIQVRLWEESFEAAVEEGKAAGLEEGKAAGLEEGKAAGLEEGKAAGLEEGKAAGLEEGKAAGLEEGKAEERKRAIEQMMQKGISEEIIKGTYPQ